MKSLFICNTPFQVLSSLFINNNAECESDLFIVNSFKAADNISENIIKEKLFKKVIVIDEKKIWNKQIKNTISTRISTISTYIHLKRIVESISDDPMQYSDLYVANRAAVNRLFCMYMAKYNPSCRIHYFDDGIATYDGTVIDVKFFDKALRLLLVGPKAAFFKYDSILYSPSLYKALYPSRDIVINKMPIPDYSSPLMNSINRIFETKSEDVFNTKAIVFDLIPELEFDEKGVDSYLFYMSKITERIACTIKPHPRATKRYFNCNYFENSKVPFEVLCCKQDFSDKIMICNFSTAVLTPKLLFDQEPVIIMLYKLQSGHRRNGLEYNDEILKEFSKMYNDPRKVVIPKSEDELMNVLDSLTS